jgi:hypothetical protein
MLRCVAVVVLVVEPFYAGIVDRESGCGRLTGQVKMLSFPAGRPAVSRLKWFYADCPAIPRRSNLASLLVL